MSKKIYISRSNHIHEGDTIELWRKCRGIFKTSGTNISTWDRDKTYDPSNAIHCDIFILLVENNCGGLHVGKGSYKELIQALNYGKTVMLAYRRISDGVIHLYSYASSTIVHSGHNSKVYARIELGPNVTNKVSASYQEHYDMNIKRSPMSTRTVEGVNVDVNVQVQVSNASFSTRLSQLPGWKKIPVKRR